MIPPPFDYVRPATLDDVIRALAEHEGDAKLLAGGYSLLPLLKLRLAEPGLLVDLRDVPGLDGIAEDGDQLRIGGRATHRQILEHPIVRARYPLLRDAAGGIGDPQIRNWGTIGGSTAHADPSADWPAVLIATRATIVCQGADLTREISAREFFLDSFETAIGPAEVLTEIRCPALQPGSGGAYQKLERRAGDYSTVGCAVQLRVVDGRLSRVGVGLTAVGPFQFAATDAEAILEGSALDDATYRRAGEAAAAQSSPVGDSHGPADYKRAMVTEMTVRALRLAVRRAAAGGGEATQ
jgi:carbon-monoxide dehydrogenase medium subunit